MLTLQEVILSIVFLVNFFLFLLLITRKRKDALLFALAVIGILLWTACVFIYPFFKNETILYFIGILAYLAVLLTMASILLFSCLFPENSKPISRLTKIIIFGGLIFGVVITLIPGFVLKGVTGQGYSLITGEGIYLFFGIVGIFIVWFLTNLIKKYFTLKGVFKLQLKYLFSGLFFASIIGFFSNAVLAAMGIYELIWLGPAATVIFVVFTTIAVTRHHLFEIKVIATEMLVGFVAIVILVDILLSETLLTRLFKSSILVVFLYLGWSLIRSVLKEIERREKLERMSKKLRKAYEDLKNLDKAKDEFISIASHQLRTPLTIIKGYISMILEGSYGKISDKIEKALINVFNSNERLIKLVNELLTVSKIEAGRIEMNLEKIDLASLILDLKKEFMIKAEEKKLYLRFKTPKSLPKILVDKMKIRQVILNIIDNAIRYTHKGGIEIRIKEYNSKIRIIIQDTGEGLTREEKSVLFSSFSRGSAGTKFWTGGTGLGLYVAKNFIDLHKGKIWAESEGKSKGTAFYIELPRNKESRK